MSVSMHITNEAFRLKLQYASSAPEKLEGLVAARRDTNFVYPGYNGKVTLSYPH